MCFRGDGGVPGERTQENDHMRRGFDALEDSSPFMVEPTYDPKYGGWMTNEMRAHLKFLQTGTVNQVDLHRLKEEQASASTEYGPVKDAAVQCMLLGGPLGSDPVDEPCPRDEMRRVDPMTPDQDAAKDELSEQGSQGNMTISADDCDIDPAALSGDGHHEQTPSGRLVRMSRPIGWMQRKWLPFPDARGD